MEAAVTDAERLEPAIHLCRIAVSGSQSKGATLLPDPFETRRKNFAAAKVRKRKCD